MNNKTFKLRNNLISKTLSGITPLFLKQWGYSGQHGKSQYSAVHRKLIQGLFIYLQNGGS